MIEVLPLPEEIFQEAESLFWQKIQVTIYQNVTAPNILTGGVSTLIEYPVIISSPQEPKGPPAEKYDLFGKTLTETVQNLYNFFSYEGDGLGEIGVDNTHYIEAGTIVYDVSSREGTFINPL